MYHFMLYKPVLHQQNLIKDKPATWLTHYFMAYGISVLFKEHQQRQRQEAPLSPRDRAMRLVSSNLANYHATAQKLLLWQVLTKPMVLSWRQCVINKPTTVELCISPVYRRLAVEKLLTWPWPRPLRKHLLITRLRLCMANTCTKFEVSSVGRCGEITRGIKF